MEVVFKDQLFLTLYALLLLHKIYNSTMKVSIKGPIRHVKGSRGKKKAVYDTMCSCL